MAQINKPDTYFNTVLWTGDGTTKNITGVGFQPDLVWAKKRSATGFHAWCDSVRGGTKNIFSNSSGAEETSATDWILSFASDGFGVNSAGNLNQSAATYVGWNWLASNTTASNTDGSITSTVSANTTSGFSIVSYTGTGVGNSATIGHSLGVAPSMIIVKSRDSTGRGWIVYHKSLGATKKLDLNDTTAATTSSGNWNDTEPTSTVFSVGTGGDTNTTDNFIAYCFAEKKGFSKFGSYTGNGSTDGPFIYTGFKPAFVLLKRTDTSGNPWLLNDNKRDAFNFCRKNLFPDTSGAEADVTGEGGTIDILSQGFKLRSLGTTLNGSGSTYIYMAFAENPLVGTNNIPATAR